jgi:hypothetical protein
MLARIVQRHLFIAMVLPWPTGASAQAVAPRMAPATEARIETVSAQMRALVLEPGPEAGRRLVERVRHGLPPAVLAVMLDVLREHPRADAVPVLRALARDRRPEIRGRALVAWAELGGVHASGAIAAAADDVDARIRLLAWALAQHHPSAAAEEVVHTLAARDAEVAARVEAARRLAMQDGRTSGEGTP